VHPSGRRSASGQGSFFLVRRRPSPQSRVILVVRLSAFECLRLAPGILFAISSAKTSPSHRSRLRLQPALYDPGPLNFFSGRSLARFCFFPGCSFPFEAVFIVARRSLRLSNFRPLLPVGPWVECPFSSAFRFRRTCPLCEGLLVVETPPQPRPHRQTFCSRATDQYAPA